MLFPPLKLPRFLFLLLVSATLATGCAKKQTGDGAPPLQPTNEIPMEALPESQEAALRTDVRCEGKDCNPSVGMLIAAEETNLRACTASMVSEDVAITNSHCIPDELKVDGADCRARIHLFFPSGVGFPAERLDCAQVIHASDIQVKGSPDYAFLRMKTATRRPFLRFSDEGLVEGQTYSLPKVDPSSKDDHFAGTLRNTQCVPIYSTILAPSSVDSRSPVMAFRDCDIMHGNSGSPILDSNGKIHGVIQAVFETTVPEYLEMKKRGGLLDGTTKFMATGTNLACVENPISPSGRLISESCRKEFTVEENTLRNKLHTEVTVNRLAKEAFGKIKRDLPAGLENVFEWSFTSRGKGVPSQTLEGALVPTCFRPIAEWKIFADSQTGAEPMKIKIRLPIWEVKLGVNQYLQNDMRLSPLGSARTEFELVFNPKDFVTSGASTVGLMEVTPGLSQEEATLIRIPMSVCE